MRHYKIFNRIRADKPKDITFGADDGFKQVVTVGASKTNAHQALTVEVNCFDHEPIIRRFEIMVDGQHVKTLTYNKRTHEFTLIKDLIPCA